ncbi:MAG: hypothetical protein ACRC33_07510 [Gemmataceae bacterium]
MADTSRVPPPPLPPRTGVLDALPADDFLDPSLVQPVERPPFHAAARYAWRVVLGFFSALEWLLGAGALTVTLAVLAALPLLQFLSLGYLLEASARVARTGKLREGFFGVRLAARLGGAVAACWVLLIPVRVVSGLAHAAYVIDPGGPSARAWRFGLLVLIALTALHLGAALARGGRLHHFLWPFNAVWLIRRVLRGGYFVEARDAVWATFVRLQLDHYFWLGLRGWAAALAWLILPVSMMAAGNAPVPVLAPVVGWAGTLLLIAVVVYLPFLQTHMAEKDRFLAAFDVLGVRAAYRRAPWIFALSFVLTLLSAVPLYLLKIEVVPREAAWLPSLVFIAFIFPARLLAGWALGCANARARPAHGFFRWTGRLPVLPAVLFYVLIVYFSQFTNWNGVWSLYEQHAFLLPVPFFGM